MDWPCFETHDRLLHEITEGRVRVKPTTGRRRIQMLYMICQMMMAMLHSNGQQRTEMDVHTKNSCLNLLCSRGRMHDTVLS